MSSISMILHFFLWRHPIVRTWGVVFLVVMVSLGTGGSLRGELFRGELLPVPDWKWDLSQIERVQRSIEILKLGTPTNQPLLKVLIYGQSHSVTEWWVLLWQTLAAKYPNSGVFMTNRAIVGYDVNRLSYTVEADVGPIQPDLVILQCNGANLDDYERLYRTIRKSCVADVMIHPEHPINVEDVIDEPSEKLEEPFPSIGYMKNYVWLPELANKYGHSWVDIRTPWKAYLNFYGLKPKALLNTNDYFHANYEGNVLIKDIMLDFLSPREFKQRLDPYNCDRVQTATVGSRIFWVNDALDLTIYGNRVEVVYEDQYPIDVPTYFYTLDGKDPKDCQELYAFQRSSAPYGVFYWMPGLMSVDHEAPLLDETWSLQAESIEDNGFDVTYTVTGSKTGFDGRGNSKETFVSNSKRVKLLPQHVNVGLAFRQYKVLPPRDFKITWEAIRRSADTIQPFWNRSTRIESSEDMFLSSIDGPHRVRIAPVSGKPKGIKAIRVYSPSGKAALSSTRPLPVVPTLAIRSLKTEFEISWSKKSSTGWIESSTHPSEKGGWAPVTFPIVDRGTDWISIVPRSGKARFFRWRSNGISD